MYNKRRRVVYGVFSSSGNFSNRRDQKSLTLYAKNEKPKLKFQGKYMKKRSIIMHDEFKVVLAVFTIILFLEVVLILTEDSLSGNIKHIRSISQKTQELAATDGKKIMMIQQD